MGMLAEAGGTSSQANWSLGRGSAAARPALDDHWKGVIAMPEPAPPPLQVLDLTHYLRHRIAHTGQRSKD
jgi:hypothetical protein